MDTCTNTQVSPPYHNENPESDKYVNLSVHSSDNDENHSVSNRFKNNIQGRKLSRSRKFRYTKKFSDYIESTFKKANLNKEDEIVILTSLSERFGISNVDFKKTMREETRGRKQLPLETRQAIWEFWYNNSSTSTITSRPAKNRVDSIPKLQQGLQYHDGVKEVINKRNVEIFESPWMIVQETVRQLHKEFTETTEIPVSIGTFLALRPFYIRSPKMQDIEMCVCKTHLHARWAIEVLLKLTREQNIPVNFTNYKSFFQEVYSSQCVMPDGLGEYIR